MSEQRSRLIETAYAAALDDSLWLDWANDMTTAMGCVSASFFVFGDGDRPVERMATLGRGNALLEGYRQHWWQHDPQVALVGGVKRSTIYRSEDHVDESDAAVRDYCRWQSGTAGIHHHIAAIATLGRFGRKGGLSMHRSVDAGIATRESQHELAAMLPDIVRAFRLGFQHQAMLATSFWEGMSARSADEAMLLLDERGAVMRATDAATAIIADHDGLTLTHHHLHAATPSDDAAVAALIGRATATVAPASGAMRVRRASGRRCYVVVVVPLVRGRRMLAPLEAAALIRIVDPHAVSRPSTAFYRQAFGCTDREAQLAAALMAGHSAESAAAALGIGLATARTHLRRLFEKTGTTGQTALLRLLAGLT